MQRIARHLGTAFGGRAPGFRPVAAAASVMVAAMVAGGSLVAAPPAGAWGHGPSEPGKAGRASRIPAVGAESQYASVIGQVGGRYVKVSAVLDDPRTDPHSFELSPSVAERVAAARVVVQNGLGYDAFMDRIEAASPRVGRRVVTVQELLGLPESTPNPHLWYRPGTMVAVAAAVARDLGSLAPAHAAYFSRRARAFDRSLGPFRRAVAAFRARHEGTPVAATEPVADDLLRAMGLSDRTPFVLESDVMNGLDPSPEDIAAEEALLAHHEVRALVYNQQVVDPLTRSFRSAAEQAGIPVVGVDEIMPAREGSYGAWMRSTVEAIERAVEHRGRGSSR